MKIVPPKQVDTPMTKPYSSRETNSLEVSHVQKQYYADPKYSSGADAALRRKRNGCFEKRDPDPQHSRWRYSLGRSNAVRAHPLDVRQDRNDARWFRRKRRQGRQVDRVGLRMSRGHGVHHEHRFPKDGPLRLDNQQCVLVTHKRILAGSHTLPVSCTKQKHPSFPECF